MADQENQLVTYARENQLDESRTTMLLTGFGEPFQEAQKLVADLKDFQVKSEDDKDLMLAARKRRLQLKDIRVKSEHVRKQVKEQTLREGKAIDGMANIIKAIIVPAEEFLEEQEKFAEKLEAERRKTRIAERSSQLLLYISESSLQAYNYADLSDEEFADLLSNVKAAHDKKIADQAAADEAERLAAAKKAKEEADRLEAERIEQERIREENEKLKAAEAERIRIDEIASSFQMFYSEDHDEAEATQALAEVDTAVNELEEADAQDDTIIHAILNVKDDINKHLAYLAKEKADAAERAAAAEKQRIADEKLAAERAAREKLEREAHEREEAAAEAKRLDEERIAKEEAEKAEAEKRKALAPDKEKLQEVLADMAKPVTIKLSTPQAQEILDRINQHQAEIIKKYQDAVNNL